MSYEKFTREDIMDFFRSERVHQLLTPDDCREIFIGIMPGSSDFTKELFSELTGSYDIPLLENFLKKQKVK